MSLKGRDVIHVRDFSRREIDRILEVTEEFETVYREAEQKSIAEGRILATLFFEPSTRTKFAFESAMLRLGGGYIGWAGTEYTSYKKGERFSDGIRMIDEFCNVIAIRHPEEGSAQAAADVVDVPVINCGDGANQHPTQCFLELYAIRKFKGRIGDLNVALMGDLKHQRVARSLVYGLAMYKANMIFVSPKELAMSEDIVNELEQKYRAEITFMEQDEAMQSADVLYMVPVEIERFKDPKEFEKFRGIYRIDLGVLKRAKAKKDLIVMHCLPRKVERLATEIDETPYAGYWKTYEYAVPSKMAILALILGVVE